MSGKITVVLKRFLNFKTFGYYLLAVLLFYLVLASPQIYATILVYGLDYAGLFYLPKFLPILIFGLFLILKPSRLLESACKVVMYVSFGVMVATLGVLGFQSSLDLSIGVYVWSWIGVVTWVVVWTVSLFLCYCRTGDTVLSFVFSALLLSAGGYFYEIPLFVIGGYPVVTFDYSFPFLIDTGIFSLFLIGCLCYRQKWKLTPWTVGAFLIYIAFAGALIIHPFRFDGLAIWVPRLIGSGALLSVIAGFKGNKAFKF